MSAQPQTRPFEREPSAIEWEWICGRLGKRDMLDGTTTRAIRVGRWRAYLVSHGLGDAPAYKRSTGESERWSELFLRVTGEALGDAPDVPNQP